MTDTNQQSDEDGEMVQCRACGTKFYGVDEEACDRWMASHVLGEHEEEAPEPVLEEARERLEAEA